MKSQINLATPKKVTKQALRRFHLFSLLFFSISFIIAVCLLILALILNSNLANVETRISDINRRISLIADKKEKELFIKNRLGNIQKVITNRKDLNAKISPIIATFPQNADMDSIIAKDEVVTIYISAPSLADLDTLINEKITAYASTPKSTIRKIDIGDFGISNGIYSVSLDFYFIVKGVAAKE
jgi:hypothetical protein